MRFKCLFYYSLGRNHAKMVQKQKHRHQSVQADFRFVWIEILDWTEQWKRQLNVKYVIVKLDTSSKIKPKYKQITFANSSFVLSAHCCSFCS